LQFQKDAAAAGGEFGILEGRSFALIHPIVMGGLFAYTLWTGYLGWQWRRVRTIQSEISDLKKQLKPTPVSPDGSTAVDSSSPPSTTELQIQRLTEERKELVKGSYRDKHFDAGSVLLGFGVLEAVFGGVNTYLRTGKLFPGPHLYAGAGTLNLSLVLFFISLILGSNLSKCVILGCLVRFWLGLMWFKF